MSEQYYFSFPESYYSGSFAFVDGPRSYANATALKPAMAEDRQAHLCYAKKLAGFALQRDVNDL